MNGETIAVLGAGTMGHGIAQVAAMSGYATRMFDVDEEAVRAGLRRIEANLENGIVRGKVEPEARDRALSALSTHTVLAEAADGADTIIEAAPERLDLKQRILSECAEAAGPGASA